MRNSPADALSASTYETGLMVAAAVNAGATHVLVAAGGSATTDGGAGADAVLDAAGFDALLTSADAVVVGERRLDSQTGEGKIISAILERVRNSGRKIPVCAVVGSVAEDLGSYAENFAEILIATDAAMRAAGKAIAAL